MKDDIIKKAKRGLCLYDECYNRALVRVNGIPFICEKHHDMMLDIYDKLGNMIGLSQITKDIESAMYPFLTHEDVDDE